MSITNNNNTTINGNQYEFANVLLMVGGIPVSQGCIEALNYDWKLEPGVVNTNQIAPTGRTAGTAQPATGSITWLPGAYDEFVKQVAFASGAITNIDFDIVVVMSVTSTSGSFTRQDLLNGCRITGTTTDMRKGSEELLKVSTLSIMQVIENGTPAWTPGTF